MTESPASPVLFIKAMKKHTFVSTLLLLLISGSVYAQILNPVKWSYAAKKINANEAVIYIKATIQPDWLIYSQHLPANGPAPTVISFPPSKAYSLIGKTAEPAAKQKFEDVFKVKVGYFEKSVVFQQRIKLNQQKVTVKGSVSYQTCDPTQCIPGDIEFSIPVS